MTPHRLQTTPSRFGSVRFGRVNILPAKVMGTAMDPIEWCNTRLRAGADSPRPGRVTLEHFQEDPIKDLVDPAVSQTTLMTASQVSKTFIFSAGVLYHIDQQPCAILVCGPTGQYNRRFISTKMEPMLTANPLIDQKITRNRLGNIPSTETTKFLGGSLSWATGKAASTQKGHSAPLVFCDEVDEYTQMVDVENPLDFLLHRGITFGARQRAGVASTPSVEGAQNNKGSLIYLEFLKGTQSKFYVPCPHCGFRDLLHWSNVDCPIKPDEGEPEVPEEDLYATYICSECEQSWSEADRLHAVRQGIWLPTIAGRSHHSYQLSQLYSPFVSLLTTVKEYHKRSEKGFTTQVLAEPFSLEILKMPDPSDLEYLYGNLPPSSQGHTVTVGIDIQGKWIEIVVLEFWGGEEHIRVQMHIQISRRGLNETVSDVAEALWRFRPDMIFVDEGFDTDWARDFVALLDTRFYDKVFSTRGRAPSWNREFTLTLDLSKRTKYLATDSIKLSVFETLPQPGVWSINPHTVIRDHFLPSLCSERMVQVTPSRIAWQKLTPKTRNEVLDCVGMAWAAKRYKDARLILLENMNREQPTV